MLIHTRYSKTLKSHKMQLELFANAHFKPGDYRLIQTTRQSSTEKGTHGLSALPWNCEEKKSYQVQN